MMPVGSISESLEDYLEIIYLLCRDEKSARVKDIASRKNVAMSSVVLALKRLQKDGYIRYESRGTIELTPKGEELASSVIGRHQFLKDFLVNILKVEPEVAEKDACSFEHSMSGETLRRLVAFFEFAESSGMNIEERFQEYLSSSAMNGAEGEKGRGFCRRGMRFGGFRRGYCSVRTLTDLKPGETGRITRLRASSQIRQRLIDMGVLPNVEVTLERTAPFGDPIVIKLRGYHLSLRRDEAESILLDVVEEA